MADGCTEKRRNTMKRLRLFFSLARLTWQGRSRGPVVRALGLHAVALGSNPVLRSGSDLFPVVPDSTLLHFVNKILVSKETVVLRRWEIETEIDFIKLVDNHHERFGKLTFRALALRQSEK